MPAETGPLRGRNAETIVLAVPSEDPNVAASLQSQFDWDDIHRLCADASKTSLAAALEVPDVAARAVPADFGRRASVLGQGTELLIETGAVYGGISALAAAGRVAKAVSERIHQRIHRHPLVTLGYARAVAAAALAADLNHDDFQLLGSGDVRSHRPDQSFTGEDAFWVCFGSGPRIYQFIVEADGRVHGPTTVVLHDNFLSRLMFMPGDNPLPEDEYPTQ